MADRNRNAPRDERIGRGVKEGLDGGVSRNARTSDQGGRNTRDERDERGEGGYGASSGYSDAGGTSGDAEELRPGATEARTRPGDVGRQAESGMETDPDEGINPTADDARERDRGGRKDSRPDGER